MSDNVDITAGSGTPIATDEILGAHYQRVKVTLGADGQNAGDVSAANPLPATVSGETVESLEAIRFALEALVRNMGQAYPDVSGRLRVAIDAISASLTLATITTVGTVTTVTTVGTVTKVGGVSANQQVPALTLIAAESLRRNISVT